MPARFENGTRNNVSPLRSHQGRIQTSANDASTSIPGPSRWDGDEDPGKIRFIVPKFWGKNRMRSETQPYSTVLQYSCVALRMRFFSQNFGTIKWILPGSSSPSHREGPGTEVDDAYASVRELRIFEYQYEQTNC